MLLDAPIQNIPRITPAYARRLLKLGVKTLRDLFYHFPHRYEDFSQIINIEQLEAGQVATVQGRLTDLKSIRLWKKRSFLVEAYLEDATGQVKIIWFNQPYLTKTLKIDDQLSISGKVQLLKSREAETATQLFNRVHPVKSDEVGVRQFNRVNPVKSDEVGVRQFNRVNLDKDLYFTNPSYEKMIKTTLCVTPAV